MMRGPEDVGCAHCARLGATLSCSICRRLVCADCAGKPMSCNEATGFELRLGMGARVRAIDPAGRLALVVHPLRSPRLVDLRAGRWLGSLDGEALHPVLTAGGLLLGLVAEAIDRDTQLWTRVHARDAQTGQDAWLEHVGPLTQAGLGISPGGTHVWYRTRPVEGGGYAIGVIRPPRAVTDYALPYSIDAAAIDGEHERLAIVGGNRLAAYQMIGSRLVEIGALQMSPVYKPRWLGLAGESLIAVVEHGAQIVVTQHDLDAELRVTQTRELPGPFGTAAISIDGAHAAVAVGRALCVLDLRERTTYSDFSAAMLGGHTDAISYLRFATDGALSSADDDNRVLVRRRLPEGLYATEVVRVDLTD